MTNIEIEKRLVELYQELSSLVANGADREDIHSKRMEIDRLERK